MKSLLFINGYNQSEVALKTKVSSQGISVEVIDVMEQDNPFKKYIRATPALITITDDVQGEFLNLADVDQETYITALLVESQDKEEKIVHKQDNKRLDCYVNSEKSKAIDDYTLELIEGGLL